MPKYVETIIVGGGQAGLAASYYLSQAERPHLILERSPHAAHAWRDQRWDSFTLVTPNWTVRMPGAEYDGPNPKGFLSREQVVEYLEQYVARFRLPVRYGVEVTSVRRRPNGYYLINTSAGTGSVANRENGESRACVPAGSYAAMPKIVWINWRCATGSPLANQRT